MPGVDAGVDQPHRLPAAGFGSFAMRQLEMRIGAVRADRGQPPLVGEIVRAGLAVLESLALLSENLRRHATEIRGLNARWRQRRWLRGLRRLRRWLRGPRRRLRRRPRRGFDLRPRSGRPPSAPAASPDDENGDQQGAGDRNGSQLHKPPTRHPHILTGTEFR